MKKVILIGPVYPYKGGIAHYTSLMYDALSKENDVDMLSFKLQYPKFLYPGEEQKDYENDGFEVENTEFIINSINPSNWLIVSNSIINRIPDLVIFQWWHPFFAPAYTSIAKKIKKNSNCRILILAHNTLPHEKFPFDKILTKRFFKYVDYFIVQSKEDEMKLINLKPNAIYKRTFLPTYNVFKYEGISQEEARTEIGINRDSKVLLFFGFIRDYKGLIYLIKAMPKIVKHLKDVQLLIVGDFYDDKQKYLNEINKLKINQYIKIIDGYIPDKEVENYFTSCNVVVLPYISATQSAIIQIAYGFEKPVIATNVGGLPEVIIDKKTGRLVEPKDEEQLADVIIDFFKNNESNEYIQNIIRDQEKYSWEKLVEKIFLLYNNKEYKNGN